MASTPVFSSNREIGAPTKLGWRVLDLTGQKFNSVDDSSDILAKFNCDSIKIVQIMYTPVNPIFPHWGLLGYSVYRLVILMGWRLVSILSIILSPTVYLL